MTLKRGMKIHLIIFYLLAGVQSLESVIHLTGYEGGSAVIKCSYDRGYEGNSKYLCRGTCPAAVLIDIKDIPVQTPEGETHAEDGRFSLHDDTTAGIFTVTITGLTAEDSGQYWCGVKTGLGKKDVYKEVELNVIKGPSPTSPSTLVPSTENHTLSPSSTYMATNTSQSERVLETTITGQTTVGESEDQGATVIILILCAVVLLAIGTVCGLLLAFYHKQRRKKLSAACGPSSLQDSEDMEQPHVYETYEEPGHVSKPRASVSSLYCLAGPHHRPSVLSLYSTVFHVSSTPADSSVRKTPDENSAISPVTQESEQHIYDSSQENIAIYSNDILPEETASPTMYYSSVALHLSTSVNIPSALIGEDDFIFSRFSNL